MPQLVLADIDETVVGLLQQRAAARGRSDEAEAGAILEAALRAPEPSARHARGVPCAGAPASLITADRRLFERTRDSQYEALTHWIAPV